MNTTINLKHELINSVISNESLSLQIKTAKYGLVLRGGFHPNAEDKIPRLENDTTPQTLILFGNAGSSLWPNFSASAEYKDGNPDPLNRWSERIGSLLAAEWGGEAHYPFGGPPFKPFLQWAKRAEDLQSSKLGMLIHPTHGLWHAYRFAIALPNKLDFPTQIKKPNPCDSCQTKPCLITCPVNAFTEGNYDVEVCYQYLKENPKSTCHSQGCQARKACPEGKSAHYEPDHAAFHMQKFYRSLQQRFD